MRAHIVLRSQKNIQNEISDPASIGIFSIGGFSAKHDDVEYSFDWFESRTNVHFDEEGRLVSVSSMLDFDEETFIRQNEEVGITHDMLTPDFIVASALTEVSYECYKKEVTIEDHIEMDLVQFQLIVYDDMGEGIAYSFSPEQIDAYNQLIASKNTD